MIIVEQKSRLRCITQTDHAVLSAELLELWILNGLPEHPRRNDLLFAVREHDNGWREADAAPRTNPQNGRPYDYRSHPDALRLELWQRGVQRLSASYPYASLLVATHCLGLHKTFRDRPGWSAFLGKLETVQDELLKLSGLSRQELTKDYAWLELGDTLSLIVCDAWNHQTEKHGSTIELHEGNLEIEPFAFAGTTTFEVACRYVPKQAYLGNVAFASALAEAKWEQHRFKVRPRRLLTDRSFAHFSP